MKDVVLALLNRGVEADKETEWFEEMRHDELISRLIKHLDAHRHFMRSVEIEVTQALNERGVDVHLRSARCSIGIQLKSHGDVMNRDFALKVKAQLAESLTYGLDTYFVLMCAAVVSRKGDDNRQKINQLKNQMLQVQGVDVIPIGPQNLVKCLREQPTVAREEMLLLGAIEDSCLRDYERGYEHCSEPATPDIVNAREAYESLGDNALDTEEGYSAFLKLKRLIEDEQIRLFEEQIQPLLPSDVWLRRKELATSLFGLLRKCRSCRSWTDRSEYKLPSWMDHVEERMVPFVSLPKLLQIEQSVNRYLEVHQDLDRQEG